MNDNPYNTGTVAGSSAMSFLLGAVTGAAIALLFAPDAGSETRARLAQAAKRVGSKARQSAQELSQEARDAMERGRQEYEQEKQKRDNQQFEPGRV